VTFADGSHEQVTFRTPQVDEPAEASQVLLKRTGRDLVALALNVNPRGPRWPDKCGHPIGQRLVCPLRAPHDEALEQNRMDL